MIDVLTLLAVTLISCFSSGVGIISGFGMSTVMIPVLLLFLPFTQAIMLSGIVHWFHNIWVIMFFGYGIDWRIFALFGMPGIVTSFMGAFLVGQHTNLLLSFLGVFLISYAIFIYVVPSFVLPFNNWSAFLGGGLSGFFAGIFGIRGPVRSLFLSAYDLPKEVYIGTTGIISLLIDSTRLITYHTDGMRLDHNLLWGLIAFVPASFIGAQVGRHLVHRIPQDYFRNVISLFLVLIGIRLILMPFF